MNEYIVIKQRIKISSTTLDLAIRHAWGDRKRIIVCLCRGVIRVLVQRWIPQHELLGSDTIGLGYVPAAKITP